MIKKSLLMTGIACLFLTARAQAEDAATTTVPATQAEDTSAPAAEVSVDKMALGTGVESHEVVGEAQSFEAGVSRVYCWTKIKSSQVPTAIKHVWFADGKEVSAVPLTIKYASTRTWSYKTIWPGQWKVEIRNEADQVLTSTEFSVSAAQDAATVPGGAATDTSTPAGAN